MHPGQLTSVVNLSCLLIGQESPSPVENTRTRQRLSGWLAVILSYFYRILVPLLVMMNRWSRRWGRHLYVHSEEDWWVHDHLITHHFCALTVCTCVHNTHLVNYVSSCPSWYDSTGLWPVSTESRREDSKQVQRVWRMFRLLQFALIWSH